MKGKKLSMMEALQMKTKLEMRKKKVQASLNDGDVDKGDI